MSSFQAAILAERRWKLFFFISALVLIGATIVLVQGLLVSMLLALVSYYLLAPAVDFLERRGFSRLVATSIPFGLSGILILGSLIVFFPTLVSQIQTLQSKFPQYSQSAALALSQLQSQVSTWTATLGLEDWIANLQPQLMESAGRWAKAVPDLISQSLTIFVMAPLLTFFLLLDGRDFSRRLMALVPNDLFEMALDLNHQIASQIGGFIRARLLEGFFVGLIVWIGLAILGFPYALLLGAFAGLINIIPYLGPVIGAVPALLIALSNQADTSDLLLVGLVYLTAQVIDSVILVPFLVAKIVDLHPVTVIITIILGAQFGGILGMIVCIPVVSILKVTLFAVYRHLTHFRA